MSVAEELHNHATELLGTYSELHQTAASAWKERYALSAECKSLFWNWEDDSRGFDPLTWGTMEADCSSGETKDADEGSARGE